MPELFDPFAEDTRLNIYERYKLLRDEHPVYYNAERDFYALSRYADIQVAARDWRTFSNAEGVDLDYTGQELEGPGDFLELDPPRHDQLRAIVQKRFMPRAIAGFGSLAEQEVARIVDAFAERRHADFATEFAWPIAISVGSAVIGIPPADRMRAATLIRTSFHRELGDPTISATARQAAHELHELFEQIVAERGRDPQDDVISVIAHAEGDGAPRAEEVTGMCYLIFAAAMETTSSLISNSLQLLAEHPDQRRYLWADLSRLPNAVEELLRFITPVQNLMRTTTRDVELHGQAIPKGARVALLFASANRDERHFERPDELDLSRTPRRHLGFGEGIHFCLGAHLARLQARTALTAVAERMPDYRVVGPVEQSNKQNERGLLSLPVEF